MNLRALRASKTDDTMVALIPEVETAYTKEAGVSILDKVVTTA